ncbi:disease resistance protein RUN1-like [Prosopis cineraria]|uniref:disease resistance protein RUN1-like n=1 Tax=Prosopis cineraria TaxID=364024 RepID=UPI0024100D68|nr:disease resistance protein RUN1-like [Prosopis cineraria]
MIEGSGFSIIIFFEHYASSRSNESEDVNKIVKNVCEILDKKDPFVVDHPVGVDDKVQEVITMLQNHQSEEVIVVGIWGMGGIGKLTITKAIYNEIGRLRVEVTFERSEKVDRSDVTRILNGCGFLANLGIKTLVERSLVTIDNKNKLVFFEVLSQTKNCIFRQKHLRRRRDSDYFVLTMYRNAGIFVVEDDTDELNSENEISIEPLQNMIEGSAFSIIIFSEHYASSIRCLEELVKIMYFHKVGYNQVDMTKFYGVDPLDVRDQKSNFGKAFRSLVQRISPTKDQVLRSRTALIEAEHVAKFVVPDSKSK